MLNDKIVGTMGDHNHTGDAVHVTAAKIVNEIKDHAVNSLDAACKIVAEV